MLPKLYVIVDSTLSKSQQTVQAAHGVAQYVLDEEEPFHGRWLNGTLVLLKDKDLEKYKEMCDSYWREPHFNNKITAVSFYTDRLPYDLPLL